MPNIRPAKRPHSECWRQERHRFGKVFPGDVRYCEHGKPQVLTEVSPHARIQGPGTDWWRTLSPVWDPITYRRAKKALAE